MNTVWTAWLLSATLLVSACGQNAQAVEPVAGASAAEAAIRQPETPPQPAPPAKVLTDSAVLQQAQASLAARPEFQGRPVQVFEKVNFFDGQFPRIELAVQNPEQPETLLFYTYRNHEWQVSEAEDISHVKRLPRHLFALESIRFADAAAYAQRWQEHAEKVNAVWREPYYVAFIYLPKQKKRFWHTATLEAVGAQYYLSFHENGSVWEFKPLQSGSEE